MNYVLTAEDLYTEMKRMPTTERVWFFLCWPTTHPGKTTSPTIRCSAKRTRSHFRPGRPQSIWKCPLRRHVQSGKLLLSHALGCNQIFSARTLHAFKLSRGSRG